MPESQAQVGLAGAVVSGKSSAMPLNVAHEILDKMRGRKMSSLPKRKGSTKSKIRAGLKRMIRS